MRKKHSVKMNHKNMAIFIKDKRRPCKKSQDLLLTKRFFPFYMGKVKYVVNFVHGIYPKTSILLIIKLLSLAIRKKVSPNAMAFYNKGIKRNFKVEESTFCTYTYGKGPLILMLHGWCSNGARWRVYVNALVNSGYKVMVVDAPGHGTAPGRFLSIFLYAKGVKAILSSESNWHTVITHSIAGLTAMAAIGNSEQKYQPSKFIMMNTFSSATAILEKFSSCLGISEKVVIGSKEKMSQYLDFPLTEFNIQKHYNQINTNGLLIYDTDDSVVPKTEAEHIISTIKPLHVLKTDGLGHNLKCHTVVKAVLNFVELDTKPKLEVDKTLCYTN